MMPTMSRRPLTIAALVLAGATFAAASRPALPAQAPQSAQATWQSAVDAWEHGDYPDALQALQRLLQSPAAADYLERAALLTGETFVTSELTADGRNPAISADGRFASYETGPAATPTTEVVAIDGTTTKRVAQLTGGGAVFSPTGAGVAWIRPVTSPAWTTAVAAIAAAADQPPAARAGLQAQLTWLLARDGEVVVRDLTSGAERVVPLPGLLKANLTWPAGDAPMFVGSAATDLTRSDLYRIDAGGAPVRVTAGAGFTAGVITDRAGRTIAHQTGAAPTFREPGVAAAGGATGGRGAGGGRGGGGRGTPGGGRGGATYTVIDVASGATRTVTGSGLSISADGSTIAWVARDGDRYVLNAAPAAGNAVTEIRAGLDRIDAPSLSPDGQRVVYQLMTDTDWEIYLSDRTGTHQRVTRDIQHDVLPRFLTNTTLLGMMGEPRHRRSQVYDLSAGTRARVFSNNSVRTISPEYIWTPSADGRRLLIAADRDGDTVSTERGVYLVDLTRRVTAADVLARVERQLAAEQDLRARMTKAYAPVADLARTVVARGRVNRVFEYEKALFDFDSKNVSRPGNLQAIEYLEKTYRSFGYEPELQWFAVPQAPGGKTANVLATLRGTENPELVYVVSSHFDSVAVGPGADDDTSGTAALLEAARMLKDSPLPVTVVFASFTGEESGLLGSRHFVNVVREAGWKVVGALNNDMIGWAADSSRMDNTIRYSNPGIKDIQHAAAFLFTDLITYDAKYYRGTDAAAFYEAWGDIVGGIGSHPVLANPNYHQPTDLLETMNHHQILETSRVTAATLVYLASSPSRLKDVTATRTTGGVSVAWTPSPEAGVRSYIVAYGPAADPLRTRVTVNGPQATLPAMPADSVVSVKAVNARGLEGWDWARAVLK
jgi:hypothetical protein